MYKIASGSVVMLAVVAGIGVLYWGAPFFIPLFLALLIAYALTPVADALTKLVRLRVLSAALVVLGSLALVGVTAWTWSDDLAALWQRVPEAAKTVSQSLKRVAQKPSSPMQEVKRAAAEIESITQTGKSAPAPATSSTPPTTISVWQLAWTGGRGVIIVVTQMISVIFLVFFMLASGDMFKRKLVRMFGDTLSEKKITVQMIDEIDAQIRRYLVVLLVSNVLVGFGTWLAFRVMGVKYPELWGLTAGVMHTAPYFGPAIIAVGSLIAGFLQYGDWSRAFVVSGASILVATLVGSVFATWLSARQTRMNTTATFVGLLFFGWIWGLWGILLGIPLLAIVKTICEHHDAWHNVAELLSQEEEPAKRLQPTEKLTATPADDATPSL